MSKAITVAPEFNSYVWLAENPMLFHPATVRLAIFADTEGSREALRRGVLFTTFEDALEKLKELKGGSLSIRDNEHVVIYEVSPDCNRPTGFGIWTDNDDAKDRERKAAGRSFKTVEQAADFIKAFRAKCVTKKPDNKHVWCLLPRRGLFGESLILEQWVCSNEADSFSVLSEEGKEAYHTLTVFKSEKQAKKFQAGLQK